MPAIRIPWLLLTLLFAVFAAASEIDVLDVGKLLPKGRIQDNTNDAVVAGIVAKRRESIPFLIDRLTSERVYDHRVLDFWPRVREGDIALMFLSDLFTDPSGVMSSLPELCWDTVLGRSDDDMPAWELVDSYLETHSRADLQALWRQAYVRYEKEISWDEDRRFFVISGRELQSCEMKIWDHRTGSM